MHRISKLVSHGGRGGASSRRRGGRGGRSDDSSGGGSSGGGSSGDSSGGSSGGSSDSEPRFRELDASQSAADAGALRRRACPRAVVARRGSSAGEAAPPA